MSTTINNNYSRFYKGKPQSKSYSSNSAAKKDTSANAVSSRQVKDVLVKSPEKAPKPLVYTRKFMSDGQMTRSETAAKEARDAAFQEEGATQLEGTYKKVSESDEINTDLTWHETLREKAPEVCDEFDALMRDIVDHALNHRDDGEKFADRFIEMVKKAEKALAAADSGSETADGTEAAAEESDEKASEAMQEQDDDDTQEEAEKDQNRSSGMVGINAGKLARMLAAAKTRSQVQAVMSKIQSDLSECEAGKNNGMDVDEESVKAAKALLQEAKSKMASAENREATPQEEMAAAIASLM